jgi:arylsulfatase
MMGFRTPNIDRIASEGAMFNTWYGQQSCTAGRAAFITGQSPIRTGLTKGIAISGRDTDQENRTTIVQIRTVKTGPGFICD